MWSFSFTQATGSDPEPMKVILAALSKLNESERTLKTVWNLLQLEWEKTVFSIIAEPEHSPEKSTFSNLFVTLLRMLCQNLKKIWWLSLRTILLYQPFSCWKKYEPSGIRTRNMYSTMHFSYQLKVSCKLLFRSLNHQITLHMSFIIRFGPKNLKSDKKNLP